MISTINVKNVIASVSELSFSDNNSVVICCSYQNFSGMWISLQMPTSYDDEKLLRKSHRGSPRMIRVAAAAAAEAEIVTPLRCGRSPLRSRPQNIPSQPGNPRSVGLPVRRTR